MNTANTRDGQRSAPTHKQRDGKHRIYNATRYNTQKPSGFRGRAGGGHRNDARGHDNRGGNNARKITSFNPMQFINKNPAAVQQEVYVPEHTFAELPIDAKIQRALSELNITIPSPIQDQAILKILAGHDVVGLAETGTGKTAAFLIPLIERKKNNLRSTTLILAPTRELAIQVDLELQHLAKHFRFYSAVCVGGANIQQQIRQLKKTNQFIIGTPGRVKDLMQRGDLATNTIDSVVLDEADRMLDMGFIHDIKAILGNLPKKRHTLFFSATMDERTKGIVNDFMNNPVTISVKKKDVTDSIAQDVVRHGRDDKYDTLVNLLQKDAFKRVIVFGAMKHRVQKLGDALNQSGISAESIHGNKSHGQRQRSLKRFKTGEARVLVATDVAARGIHVDNVTHVINYDLPTCFEDYVHRIGRTGRGSRHGEALTFVAQ